MLRGIKAGERYRGFFRSDEKTGYGQYTWKNGDSYCGMWRRDLKHGFVKYCSPRSNYQFLIIIIFLSLPFLGRNLKKKGEMMLIVFVTSVYVRRTKNVASKK